MSTVNLVLMIILATTIGFAMGNVYGQAKMKAIFNDLLNKLTENLQAVAQSAKKGDKTAHE